MVTFQSDRFYRNNHHHLHHSYHRHHHDRNDMKLSASTSNTLLSIDSTTLSIIAGAIGGAIGVGTAYPFDKLKTVSQTFASEQSDGKSLGLLSMLKLILADEGFQGFYNGVKGVMVGEAFIESTAFASNNWALSHINPWLNNLFISQNNGFNSDLINYSGNKDGSMIELISAALFAGFITSFIANPIERVKILMQTDSKQLYKSELHCIFEVVKSDGMYGLFFRGIEAMLLREITGYGVYFVVFAVAMKSSFAVDHLGSMSSLFCGALAGCCSWIPVYPFDVIKT